MTAIRHKKSLGQHFLEDGATLQGIVEASGVGPGDRVLEIGPGSGNMTRILAARGCRLTAVEVDASLQGILEQELAPYPEARLIIANFMTMRPEQLTGLMGGPFHVVANLPYYITTPILELLLTGGMEILSVTVLIQKEAALRLISPPGSRQYGPLSVACARWGQGRIVMEVPPEAFVPPPKVDSAVVHIAASGEGTLPPGQEALFHRVVHTAFTQRRKQLRNALGGLGFPAARIGDALTAAGIEPSRRPETLDWREFAALSAALADQSPDPAR